MASFKTLSVTTACMMLAACGGADTPTNEQAPAENMAQGANVAQANLADGKAVTFTEGESEFRVSWPGTAAQIAPLDALLRGDAESLRQQTQDGMRAEQAAANEAGYPFRGYSYLEDWSVVADVPALLILQSEGYTFTGGAHGMPIVKALHWDKAGGKVLEVGDMFDVSALGAAVSERFCEALDAQRAEKRGAPVNAGNSGALADFDRCVDPTKQTIVPSSRGGGALDTIHFVIMPYEAGPYSEGIYDVEVPVDHAVLATVKPDWKSAFTAG